MNPRHTHDILCAILSTLKETKQKGRGMRANEYKVMREAVESGVRFGVRRAYKHTDKEEPTVEQQEYMVEEILNSICEWFTFESQE